MSFPSYTKVAKVEGNLNGASVTWNWTWNGAEGCAPNVIPDKDFCIVTNQALAGTQATGLASGILTLTPTVACGEDKMELNSITLTVGLNFVEPSQPCCVGMIDPEDCPPCTQTYFQFSGGSNAGGVVSWTASGTSEYLEISYYTNRYREYIYRAKGQTSEASSVVTATYMRTVGGFVFEYNYSQSVNHNVSLRCFNENPGDFGFFVMTSHRNEAILGKLNGIDIGVVYSMESFSDENFQGYPYQGSQTVTAVEKMVSVERVYGSGIFGKKYIKTTNTSVVPNSGGWDLLATEETTLETLTWEVVDGETNESHFGLETSGRVFVITEPVVPHCEGWEGEMIHISTELYDPLPEDVTKSSYSESKTYIDALNKHIQFDVGVVAYLVPSEVSEITVPVE